jgi:hypothetical protein
VFGPLIYGDIGTASYNRSVLAALRQSTYYSNTLSGLKGENEDGWLGPTVFSLINVNGPIWFVAKARMPGLAEFPMLVGFPLDIPFRFK